MSLPEKIESLVKNLPDADGARRFYSQFVEKFPAEEKKLAKNAGLLSDVLTVAAFSPLLATTILQNPQYLTWLNRQKLSVKVREKDEILESLARFALMNSEVEANVVLARFRRRELLRVYLRDVRNLGTIAETCAEISNLADAILEYALRLARQEMDNRYGAPLEIDAKNRTKQAQICVVALGKLGSQELNYASDIDLLFLYSSDGTTGGQGLRGAVSNREYFGKLAEYATKIVGGQSGEGAAYRVDLRLRPHGRVGALAIPMDEAINYYKNSAQTWERQVLIRSRSAAGDEMIFKKFFAAVESSVFSKTETVADALQNVRLSKEKINREKISGASFNVKLGKGGIREIEFIAQALQLAHGGRDRWLRAAHTLISLGHLAERNLIFEIELTELFAAYEFLRRLEHRLQMENGLQTHTLPSDAEKLLLVAKRMNFEAIEKFDAVLKTHTANVSRIFTRIFGTADAPPDTPENLAIEIKDENLLKIQTPPDEISAAPDFSIAFPPSATIADLPPTKDEFIEQDYQKIFLDAVAAEADFKNDLAALRKNWTRFILEIVAFDVAGKITRQTAKRRQTQLAEAAIEAALVVSRRELERRLETDIENFPLAVLGLGKLGGGTMDYGSDLDLILIYDETQSPKSAQVQSSKSENKTDFKLWTLDSGLQSFYARAVEIFVTALSSLTRDGYLYRVDLRLRPDGKNGATALSQTAFLDYLQHRAAIWEWLAYVKLRGVAGDAELAQTTEFSARKIIHANALKVGADELRIETRRVRERLEREKSGGRRGREIDIKFGAGGMLDVYFAVRFLQLRDNIPDAAENRSTVFMLEKLRENDSLSAADFQNFADGYAFLSELDHHLRLIVGRSTRLPIALQNHLRMIAAGMNFADPKILLENLTFHRLNIRASFENLFKG